MPFPLSGIAMVGRPPSDPSLNYGAVRLTSRPFFFSAVARPRLFRRMPQR